MATTDKPGESPIDITAREINVDNRSTEIGSDKWAYRLVIGILGATVLTIVVGLLIYGKMASSFPQSIATMGATALGALAGILMPQLNKK